MGDNSAGDKSPQVWTTGASVVYSAAPGTLPPHPHQSSTNERNNAFPAAGFTQQATNAPTSTVPRPVPAVGQEVLLTPQPSGHPAQTMVPPPYSPHSSMNMPQPSGAYSMPPSHLLTPVGSPYGLNTQYPAGTQNTSNVAVPIVYAPSNVTTVYPGHQGRVVYGGGSTLNSQRTYIMIVRILALVVVLSSIVVTIVLLVMLL